MAGQPSATDPGRWLPEMVAQDPDAPFLEVEGRIWSRRDMLDRAGRIAGAIAAQGVKPGDRVAVQVEKSAEMVALYFACLGLGAILVPLNTAYTLAELDYFLGDAEPRLTIVDPAVRDGAAPLAPHALLTLDAAGRGSLADAADRAHPVDLAGVHHDGDALAALLYTSGTTGRSKGAMLTRANLASNAVILVDAWRFTAADVLLHALPIFHVHGLFVAINTVAAAGASMLFLPRFDADRIVALLPRATVMMGVPTFYTRLLQHEGLTRDRVRTMRLFVSGSAPLLGETHRAFEALTGHAILERYGMTETLMNTSNPYDGARVPDTVGPPLPGVDLRIVDPESREMLGTDAIGMIEIRGPNLFKGYWRNPEKSAEDMREDGFFITGDVGKIDAAGYVHIVGRAKDLVISGGYNIYPQEVESEINALDGIVESAVIGVPHPDFGEAVVAVITGSADPDRIRDALKARLAGYKLPKRVIVVDELPRNAMGKVQKVALRKTYGGLFA